MNLFEFLVDYLNKQTLKKFPDFNTSELHYYYDEVPMYYVPNRLKVEKGKESIYDIMKILAYTLTFPKFCNIHLLSKYDDVEEILNGFDPNYISILNENALFEMFKTIIKPKCDNYWFGNTFNDSAWQHFSKAVISAAKYLLKYYKDFNSYINHIKENPKEALKELNTIHGFGDYCAHKFLTFIGYFEYFYVDIRAVEVFKIFDSSVKDEKTFRLSLDKQAKKAGVLPYNLHQLIKLIVSGDYYNHRLHIRSSGGKGSLKGNLYKAVKLAFENKLLDI